MEEQDGSNGGDDTESATSASVDSYDWSNDNWTVDNALVNWRPPIAEFAELDWIVGNVGVCKAG